MAAEKKGAKRRNPKPGPALGPLAERAIGLLAGLAGLDRKELSAVLQCAGGTPASPLAYAAFIGAVNTWVEQDPPRLLRAIRRPVSNQLMRREWTAGAAPMQGILEVRLDDGRRVGVSEFQASGSYSELIEGRLDKLAGEYKQRALDRIKEAWGERKTYVVEPVLVPIDGPGSPGRLPHVVCAAWLDSAQVGSDASGSELVVVWWQEKLRGSVSRLVLNVIRDLDWDSLAADFDL